MASQQDFEALALRIAQCEVDCAVSDQWSIARAQNTRANAPESTLTALCTKPVLSRLPAAGEIPKPGPPPEYFPGTIGDTKKLSADLLDDLLETYGLSARDLDPTSKLRMFLEFIGANTLFALKWSPAR